MHVHMQEGTLSALRTLQSLSGLYSQAAQGSQLQLQPPLHGHLHGNTLVWCVAADLKVLKHE